MVSRERMLICAGTEIPQTVKDKMKIPSGTGRQAPIHPGLGAGETDSLGASLGV